MTGSEADYWGGHFTPQFEEGTVTSTWHVYVVVEFHYIMHAK
jgi:hypothetical protein